MVFNQLYNRKAVSMVRKKNGLLYGILGKEEPGSIPGEIGFQRLKKVSGHNVEVKLLGKLKAIPTVADGSAEFATVTPTNSGDYWGAAEFALTHYADTHAFPASELDRYTGDELKTANYLDAAFEMLMESLENTMAASSSSTGGIHDTKAPARTTMGGWQWAASDGTSTGETAYAAYGLIDRSDSGNADFRSYVLTSTGDLTLAKIQTAKNTVTAAGGGVKLGVAHTTPYTKLQQLIQPYTLVSYDESWSKFGGEYVQFGMTKFVLDQRAPSTVLGLLTPEDWLWYQNNGPFTRTGVILDPSRVDSHVLPWKAWAQLICRCPSHQAKLTGITS